MFENMGARIRELRKQKEIGLNDFAKNLKVSPGYLSQLETGKTENISLTLLKRLQEELAILPLTLESCTEFDARLDRAVQHVKSLMLTDKESAEFLLYNLEQNIDWFTSKNI